MINNLFSIILPIYNEGPNLNKLFSELCIALSNYSFEVIAVNDGSDDDSLLLLKKLALNDKRIKVIDFSKNNGQTAAISAGIQHASGEIIILMDSDLENDPNDIPKLINKIYNGYDVVSGWRQNRWKGQWLKRKLPSILANILISKISGVTLHDYGCTLKAYRSKVLKGLGLYGEMHRFIPIYAKWLGGKVTEISVNYRLRSHGKSNYGMERMYKVLLDLILVKFLQKFQSKPIHFFGGTGFISILISFISFILAVYYKISGQKDFVQTPLPIFTAIFFIVGILMILLGIIAEVLMRTYYESQNKFPYSINEKINLNE